MKEVLLKLIRKATGYYKLQEVIDAQDDVIVDFKKLCRNIKEDARKSLEENGYGNRTLRYRAGLNKIVESIDNQLDLDEAEEKTLTIS